MSLGSLPELKSILSIASDDVSQDTPLQQAIDAAAAAVESYCKRKFARAVRTEYYDGTGTPEMHLRQRPVWTYSLAGTFSSGATTITALSSTDDLVVGMPVVHADIPAGTTIATIASSTSVTISAATTAAATAETILFGLEIFADAAGAYGDYSGGFAASTRLTLGTDFALRRDGADGASSKSGVLVRLGGSGAGGASNAWGDWGWPGSIGGGSLTARRAAIWGETRGGYKVTSVCGYAPDAVPDDLRSAVHQLAVWTWRYAPTAGLVLSNESKGNSAGSYSYGVAALASEPELASARGLLRHYREVVI